MRGDNVLAADRAGVAARPDAIGNAARVVVDVAAGVARRRDNRARSIAACRDIRLVPCRIITDDIDECVRVRNTRATSGGVAIRACVLVRQHLTDVVVRVVFVAEVRDFLKRQLIRRIQDRMAGLVDDRTRVCLAALVAELKFLQKERSLRADTHIAAVLDPDNTAAIHDFPQLFPLGGRKADIPVVRDEQQIVLKQVRKRGVIQVDFPVGSHILGDFLAELKRDDIGVSDGPPVQNLRRDRAWR